MGCEKAGSGGGLISDTKYSPLDTYPVQLWCERGRPEDGTYDPARPNPAVLSTSNGTGLLVAPPSVISTGGCSACWAEAACCAPALPPVNVLRNVGRTKPRIPPDRPAEVSVVLLLLLRFESLRDMDPRVGRASMTPVFALSRMDSLLSSTDGGAVVIRRRDV